MKKTGEYKLETWWLAESISLAIEKLKEGINNWKIY